MKHMTTLIRETGPLTFARFMELALYDDEHGYYMTGSASTASPIGREGGDFFTAPCLSPVLAKCLVRQLAEIDERLGHPPVFHLVEMGPGDGTLLRDMLQECQEQAALVSSPFGVHPGRTQSGLSPATTGNAGCLEGARREGFDGLTIFRRFRTGV